MILTKIKGAWSNSCIKELLHAPVPAELCGWDITVTVTMIQVDEFVVLFDECQFNCANRAVTLFGNNDFDNILLFRFGVVVVIPVQEADDIGILLN